MHNNLVYAWKAPRCLAQTRQKKPCQSPALLGKKRCRLHGGRSIGAPKSNQYAMRHGKYSASTILLKRQARQARRRLQVLALAARLGFDTIDGLCNDIFARLAARSAHRG